MTTNTKEFRIWMVRAGSAGYLMDEFLNERIVAIGWNDLGKISKKLEYQELKDLYYDTYTEDSDGRVNQSVGQIWRFVQEFQIGDKVITYDWISRNYYLGEIKSDYDFNTKYEYHHYRKIKWDDEPTHRDTLSTDTKNKLGSILTIFEISKEIWEELLEQNPTHISEEELQEIEETHKFFEKQELEQLKQDVVYRSLEFTKDIVANLTWEETERLVAGLLRVLGYKTRMTAKGGDLGSDIIASPDELGLQEPRIKVEVKTRSKDKIGAPDIRNFIGGLRDYNKGIFVSTTGFSKEAIYEAERANFPLTLINLDWLVELLIANYDELDLETKSLLPLKKIYWPI